MYRYGHFGAALFCYAPVGAVLTDVGEPALAAVGCAIAVALSTLPDVDQLLPIAHRGATHTIWFAALVGAIAALIGAAATTVGYPWLLVAVAGGAATLSTVSHLLADAITPMGIQPFSPISDRHYTFDITPAKNPRANTTMLGGGVIFALLCQAIVVL